MPEPYVIWVVGPREKPNVSYKTCLEMADVIQNGLNEGKEVVIKYRRTVPGQAIGVPTIKPDWWFSNDAQ